MLITVFRCEDGLLYLRELKKIRELDQGIFIYIFSHVVFQLFGHNRFGKQDIQG